jgi:hypothetical protein
MTEDERTRTAARRSSVLARTLSDVQAGPREGQEGQEGQDGREGRNQ